MAKLNISVDAKFTTTQLQITEDFKEKFLDAEKGRQFLEKIPPEELSFYVCSTNKGAEIGFDIPAKMGKKNSRFIVSMPEGADHLAVEIAGDFSVSVRAGVAPRLQECGESLDLRIKGVIWKGGSYRGFAAYVKGGDWEEKSENWKDGFPRVSSWSIK